VIVVPVAVEMIVTVRVVMIVRVMMMAMRVARAVGVGFFGEPPLHIGNLAIRIVQAAILQPVGGRFALGGVEDRCRRIERFQSRA
jgi:hypothetical protein